jgi:hypothetical protein
MRERLEQILSGTARWGAAALVPLMILIGDSEIRWVDEHAVEPLVFWPWFGASVLLSVAFWCALAVLVRGLRRRALVLAPVALAAALAVISAWRFRLVRHFDPSAKVVAFVLEEPVYALDLARAGVAPAWLGLLGLLAGAWFGLLWYASGGEPVTPKMRAIAGAVLVAVPLSVGLFFPSSVQNPWMPYVGDIRLVKVFEQGVKFRLQGAGSVVFESAERDDVEPVDDAERPSVLLILAESLRNDRTSVWGDPPHDTMPRLQTFVDQRPDQAFVFEDHTANSAATLKSGMAILLGKYQAAPAEVLRTMPTVWQYAEAAGMQSFVVSAQSWDWSNLQDFYVTNQPPDYFFDARSLGLEVNNDSGGDDIEAAEKVVELLDDELDDERPFFGLFQLNVTHYPFLPADDVAWSTDNSRGRYDASIVRSDAAVGMVLDALADSGRLEDTVIVYISDHGIELHSEADRHHHSSIRSEEPSMFHGARVASCEPVFVRTPLLIYVPERWQRALSVDPRTLRANTRRLTSHVDVLATILDVWSMPPGDELDGVSLLEPVDPDRLVYCFTPRRIPELTGLAVRERRRLVYARQNLSRPHAWPTDEAEVFERRSLGLPLDDADEALIERAAGERQARRILEELDLLDPQPADAPDATP